MESNNFKPKPITFMIDFDQFFDIKTDVSSFSVIESIKEYIKDGATVMLTFRGKPIRKLTKDDF